MSAYHDDCALSLRDALIYGPSDDLAARAARRGLSPADYLLWRQRLREDYELSTGPEGRTAHTSLGVIA